LTNTPDCDRHGPCAGYPRGGGTQRTKPLDGFISPRPMHPGLPGVVPGRNEETVIEEKRHRLDEMYLAGDDGDTGGLPRGGNARRAHEEGPMSKVINIDRCFDMFDDTFSPKIVGELNGQLVMLVRCEGDKVPWHTHDGEDEMFLVLDGVLEVQERAENVTVEAGEIYIVERGIEHRVVPRTHVKLMLFEPAGTRHTGSVEAEITKKSFDRLDI
jgi:quercetin dioxygenase-like cupin family protein